MSSEVWFGLFGPARLPAARLERLQAAAMATARDPALRERLAVLGAEPRGEDGATLQRIASEERARWVRLVRDLGIKVTE